jgi:antitoxin Phd
MVTFEAREAKNEFGRLLDTAQRETVTVKKKGRPVAVIMSITQYDHFQEVEDLLWLLKAKEAEKEGYFDTEESKNFLEMLGKC